MQSRQRLSWSYSSDADLTRRVGRVTTHFDSAAPFESPHLQPDDHDRSVWPDLTWRSGYSTERLNTTAINDWYNTNPSQSYAQKLPIILVTPPPASPGEEEIRSTEDGRPRKFTDFNPEPPSSVPIEPPEPPEAFQSSSSSSSASSNESSSSNGLYEYLLADCRRMRSPTSSTVSVPETLGNLSDDEFDSGLTLEKIVLAIAYHRNIYFQAVQQDRARLTQEWTQNIHQLTSWFWYACPRDEHGTPLLIRVNRPDAILETESLYDAPIQPGIKELKLMALEANAVREARRSPHKKVRQSNYLSVDGMDGDSAEWAAQTIRELLDICSWVEKYRLGVIQQSWTEVRRASDQD